MHFKTLIFFICLYSQVIVTAQIQNGYNTIGIQSALLKTISTNAFRDNNIFLHTTAGYGRVVADNYRLNIGLVHSLSDYETNDNFSPFSQKYHHQAMALTASVRIYHNPKSKKGIYIEIGGGMIKNQFKSETYLNNAIVANQMVSKSPFLAGVFIGFNKFINVGTALDVNIGYQNNQVTNTGDNLVRLVLLNIGLENYFTSLSSDSMQIAKGYVSKRRKTIYGKLLTAESGKVEGKNRLYLVNITPSVGLFVANRLMIGIDAQLGLGFSGTVSDSEMKISPYARYYVPIFKRLYAHPQIKWLVIHDVANINEKRNGLDVSIGCSYFMTPYLALESQFYNYHITSKDKIYNPNIGLRYFL